MTQILSNVSIYPVWKVQLHWAKVYAKIFFDHRRHSCEHHVNLSKYPSESNVAFAQCKWTFTEVWSHLNCIHPRRKHHSSAAQNTDLLKEKHFTIHRNIYNFYTERFYVHGQCNTLAFNLDNQVYYLTFNGFMKKVLGRLHNMYLIRIKYSGDVPWFYN